MFKSATGLCIVCILTFLLTKLQGSGLSAIAESRFWRFRRLMKKMTMFLMIGATVALLAVPVAATNLITVNNETVQDACSVEGKAALYKTFVDNRKDDQAKAFDAAKKYLACPA